MVLLCLLFVKKDILIIMRATDRCVHFEYAANESSIEGPGPWGRMTGGGVAQHEPQPAVRGARHAARVLAEPELWVGQHAEVAHPVEAPPATRPGRTARLAGSYSV